MKISRLTSFFLFIAAAAQTSLTSAGTLEDSDLKVGESYGSGKATLLKAGWKVSQEQDPQARAPYAKFPEISCGYRRDAVCSVGFKKGSSYLALVVEMRGKELVIAGEY